MALLLWLSLSGKGKRIQAINSLLVPLACICYVSACLVILSVYHERLAGVISAVFSSALDPAAFIGGTGGFVVSRAMHYGFTRGIFSHEAGMGSSPLAYASKQCDEPVLLGFIGIIEVFFDTFVITTISALVLLCFFSDGVFFTSDGTMLMQECFTSFFGAPGSFLFAWMIFLFAFPTMLGWYYYASRCLDYLFEGTAVKGAYRLLFVGVLYFSSMLKTDAVWEISDTLNGCMLLCNLYVLWLFQKECVRLSKEYLQRRAKRDDMLCYRPSFLLCLSYDKKTRRDGMPVLNGIDISNYQRGLDVRTIKADFVIVKASEGIGYEDPSCHTFAKAALSSKKKLGLYHFARPGKENPAVQGGRVVPAHLQAIHREGNPGTGLGGGRNRQCEMGEAVAG